MTDVIRPRRATDLDALGTALAEQQAASHYPARWPLPIPVDRFIARDGELAAWTVERDGLPVGHVSVLGAHGPDDLVTAWTGALDLDPSRLAVVSALFTATAVRGAGLGGRLLDVAVAWARDHGLAPVLEVAPGHGPAAGIYRARGWQVVARLRPDWLPAGDPDVLAMVLPCSQDADSEPTGHSWAGPVGQWSSGRPTRRRRTPCDCSPEDPDFSDACSAPATATTHRPRRRTVASRASAARRAAASAEARRAAASAEARRAAASAEARRADPRVAARRVAPARADAPQHDDEGVPDHLGHALVACPGPPAREDGAMAITTLLLDCDGVTQLNRTFRDALHRMVHPQDGMLLREALWQVERPFLARRDGFEDAMDRLVTDFNAEHGTRLTVDEILAEWNATEPVPAVLDVMDAVRARGTRLYLATNQQSVRGAHIQANLPYAEHSDGAFYSFELGVAKPSPEFFTTIVERLGIAPGEALFVDDLAANVDGARAAGLVAEQLEPVCDAAVLTAILERHGLLG